MPAFALVALTGLVVTATPHVDYATSVRAEGRLRLIDVTTSSASEGELAVNPRAGLQLKAGTLETELEYAPYAVVRGQPFSRGGGSEVLHAGTLLLGLRPDRRTVVRFIEDISYGQFRFTAPGVTTPGVPGAPGLPDAPGSGTGSGSGIGSGPAGAPDPAVPGSFAPLEPIWLIRSNARLSLDVAATRRSAFTLAGGYELSGGVDEPSRAQMPLQQGPFASVAAQYRWTRRDQLSTELSARESGFDTGTRISLAQWTSTWRHSVARNTDLALGAGAGAGRVLWHPQAEPDWQLLGNGQAILVHRFIPREQELIGAVGAQLSPVVNPFTAVLEQRLETQASLQWRPVPRVQTAVRASAASRLFSAAQVRQQVVVGTASVSWAPSQWGAVEGLMAWSWERGGVHEPIRRQWIAGVAFVASREGAL